MAGLSDPVEPNPEIAAIALRWFHSYGRGEAETILNLLSDDPALNYVGTAENEYGSGDNFRRAFPEYVAAHPLFEFNDADITAFSCGNVGWAIGLGTVNVVTGESARIRVTQIYHLVQGFWRLIHVHNSQPTPNIDGIAKDLGQLQDLLDAALSSPAELARTGLATIMFTDIADSTTIAATVGDARWSNAIKSHIKRVDQIITDHSGTMIKSLGDGTMSAFNSARAALSAATALQRAMDAGDSEPRLQTRIGLHTGDLVEEGGDMFGTVVNKAARVTSVAQPGEIRVSDATRAMVGGSIDFDFCQQVSLPLKGLVGEHTLYLLEWQT
jgi:class 3 adenylate cyclase